MNVNINKLKPVRLRRLFTPGFTESTVFDDNNQVHVIGGGEISAMATYFESHKEPTDKQAVRTVIAYNTCGVQ